MATRRNPTLILLIFVVVVIPLFLIGVGKYEPAKLAIVHERLLGFMKRDVSPRTQEQVFVDGCVQIQGASGYWAVRSIRRTTRYVDGSQLMTVYSEPPEPTSTQCP
jgi:hypothetical protein